MAVTYTYKLYKDNNLIEQLDNQGSDYTHYINQIQLMDEGSYRLEVSSGPSSINQTFYIDVYPKLEWDVEPADITAYEGDNVSISASVKGGNDHSGSPVYTYVLYKGTTAINSIETTSTNYYYQLNSVQLNDSGNYKLVVYNDNHSIESTLTINVLSSLAWETEPNDVVVEEDSPYSISAKATGGNQNYNFEYNLYKGTTLVSGPTYSTDGTYTYSRTNAALTDNGDFTLKVSRGGTVEIETTFNVYVYDKLAWQTLPQDIDVKKNNPFTITAKAVGGYDVPGQVTYNFVLKKNGVEIDQQTNTTGDYSYTKTNAEDSDEDTYVLYVGDTKKAIASPSFSVNVFDALAWVTEPQDIDIEKDNDGTITAKVAGGDDISGSISYKFTLKQGTTIIDDPVASTDPNYSYTFTNAQLSQSGTYTLEVTDGTDTLTSDFDLLVYDQLTWVTEPTDFKVVENSTINVTAEIKGGHLTTGRTKKYTFYLIDESSTQIDSIDTDDTQYSYTTGQLVVADSGTYTLHATDGDNDISSDFDVIVYYKVIWINEPHDIEVEKNSNTQITAKAGLGYNDGNPVEYTFNLYKDGTLIDGPTTNTTGEYTYDLTNVQLQDEGAYKLTVEDAYTSIEKEFNLTVTVLGQIVWIGDRNVAFYHRDITSGADGVDYISQDPNDPFSVDIAAGSGNTPDNAKINELETLLDNHLITTQDYLGGLTVVTWQDTVLQLNPGTYNAIFVDPNGVVSSTEGAISSEISGFEYKLLDDDIILGFVSVGQTGVHIIENEEPRNSFIYAQIQEDLDNDGTFEWTNIEYRLNGGSDLTVEYDDVTDKITLKYYADGLWNERIIDAHDLLTYKYIRPYVQQSNTIYPDDPMGQLDVEGYHGMDSSKERHLNDDHHDIYPINAPYQAVMPSKNAYLKEYDYVKDDIPPGDLINVQPLNFTGTEGQEVVLKTQGVSSGDYVFYKRMVYGSDTSNLVVWNGIKTSANVTSFDNLDRMEVMEVQANGDIHYEYSGDDWANCAFVFDNGTDYTLKFTKLTFKGMAGEIGQTDGTVKLYLDGNTIFSTNHVIWEGNRIICAGEDIHLPSSDDIRGKWFSYEVVNNNDGTFHIKCTQDDTGNIIIDKDVSVATDYGQLYIKGNVHWSKFYLRDFQLEGQWESYSNSSNKFNDGNWSVVRGNPTFNEDTVHFSSSEPQTIRYNENVLGNGTTYEHVYVYNSGTHIHNTIVTGLDPSVYIAGAANFAYWDGDSDYCLYSSNNETALPKQFFNIGNKQNGDILKSKVYYNGNELTIEGIVERSGNIIGQETATYTITDINFSDLYPGSGGYYTDADLTSFIITYKKLLGHIDDNISNWDYQRTGMTYTRRTEIPLKPLETIDASFTFNSTPTYPSEKGTIQLKVYYYDIDSGLIDTFVGTVYTMATTSQTKTENMVVPNDSNITYGIVEFIVTETAGDQTNIDLYITDIDFVFGNININAPIYQWYKDGTEIVGATDKELTVAIENGDHYYKCKVTVGSEEQYTREALVASTDAILYMSPPSIIGNYTNFIKSDPIVSFRYLEDDDVKITRIASIGQYNSVLVQDDNIVPEPPSVFPAGDYKLSVHIDYHLGFPDPYDTDPLNEVDFTLNRTTQEYDLGNTDINIYVIDSTPAEDSHGSNASNKPLTKTFEYVQIYFNKDEDEEMEQYLGGDGSSNKPLTKTFEYVQTYLSEDEDEEMEQHHGCNSSSNRKLTETT